MAHVKFQSTLPVWGATAKAVVSRLLVVFQSTLPVWGATHFGGGDQRHEAISIHAPRVGSDLLRAITYLKWHYFNPRSPCGERRGDLGKHRLRLIFQSTLPVWGATATFCSFIPSIASLLCSQSPIGQFHQQNSAAYPETTRNSVRTHRVASVCHLLALTAPGSLQGRSPALHRSVLLCHASYSRGGKCGRCLFPCS